MIRILIIAAAAVAAALVLMIPVNPSPAEKGPLMNRRPETIDPAPCPAGSPARVVRMLFIHHSCGGQLLAEPGPVDAREGARGIYRAHSNGGGLRKLLEAGGFEIHEASYDSVIGHDTDIFDWPEKFRSGMDAILACDHQDERYTGSERNDVVAFKPCYPNSLFLGEGREPGDPAGPELTLANARAAYRELLPEFARHPETLFICFTAPPYAPKLKPIPLWRYLARKVLGRSLDLPRTGELARRFNNWLVDRDGWLRDYPGANVVVFDYYDILTGRGKSNLSVYPTADGYDSHPSREGNEAAAKAFVPFVYRAWNTFTTRIANKTSLEQIETTLVNR